MTHTNDVQTVHTCQTRSVCKLRPPAYIQGPASISTITSDPGLYSRPGLYLRPGFYSRKYGKRSSEYPSPAQFSALWTLEVHRRVDVVWQLAIVVLQASSLPLLFWYCHHRAFVWINCPSLKRSCSSCYKGRWSRWARILGDGAIPRCCYLWLHCNDWCRLSPLSTSCMSKHAVDIVKDWSQVFVCRSDDECLTYLSWLAVAELMSLSPSLDQ